MPAPSDLFELLLLPANVQQSRQRVVENGGCAGTDGVSLSQIESDFPALWRPIEESLRRGTWLPGPLKQVELTKPDGGTRTLRIPCVLDRVVLQAMAQLLAGLWDEAFSIRSFGYRPLRSAHDAIAAAQKLIDSGFSWVVDLDIHSFFDRVDSEMLLARLSEKPCGERFESLLRKVIPAMAEPGGNGSRIGIPQGSPLSPVLANIALDSFDRWLEERSVEFVRYADDLIAFAHSKDDGERTLAAASDYLRQLRLGLNAEKSRVVPPAEASFLGFCFHRGTDGRTRRTVSPKSKDQCRNKINALTEFKAGRSFDTVARQVSEYMRGWRGYYGFAQRPNTIASLRGHARTRLRGYLWLSWKTPERRLRELLDRGVPQDAARRWSRPDISTDQASTSPAMAAACPNAFFDRYGLGENPNKRMTDSPPPDEKAPATEKKALPAYNEQQAKTAEVASARKIVASPPARPAPFHCSVNLSFGTTAWLQWRLTIGSGTPPRGKLPPNS